MGISLFQLIVVLLIILILFGRGKLPALAEDLGKSIQAFKKGLSEAEKEERDAEKEKKDQPENKE